MDSAGDQNVLPAKEGHEGKFITVTSDTSTYPHVLLHSFFPLLYCVCIYVCILLIIWFSCRQNDNERCLHAGELLEKKSRIYAEILELQVFSYLMR